MNPAHRNAVAWAEEVLQSFGDRTFLINSANGQTWIYAEFDRCVQDLAVQLSRLGVVRGDKVAVSLHNSPEFVCLYFACLRLRAVTVPINPAASRSNAAHILKACQPRVAVFESSTESLFATCDASVRSLRMRPGVATADNPGEWSMNRAVCQTFASAELMDAEADDEWLITFTSGSTSQPKAIVHRALSLLGCANAFNAAAGIDSDTRLFHVFSMTYMAGFLNTLLCPFVAGATVVLGAEFNARSALSFWRGPMSYGVNTFWVAPTVLRLLLTLDREPQAAVYCRDCVRAFHVGTAPLPVTLKEEFEARFNARILESYGLTEVLFVTTNVASGPRLRGSVGRVVPGVELRIVDDKGHDVEPGREGEIRVRTPYRMTQYLGVEDPFVDGTFPTGDLGTLTQDGMLSVTGRKKDLIIRGGLNISPREIEEVLLQHEAVECVAVIGTPHEFYGEEVTAVVQLAPGKTLQESQAEFIELCKDRLSSVCVPTRFLDLEKLPVTVTGKVKKSQVRELIDALPHAA